MDVFANILLALCVSLLVALAVVLPVIARLQRLIERVEQNSETNHLIFERSTTPGRYDFDEWPSVFSRTAYISGDTLELNTATRAFSAAQTKLETAGIPHVHQIFHVTGDGVEGVRRILDESGARELMLMARQYGQGEGSPAASLPMEGGLFRTVKLFTLRVPKQYARQAEDALGDPVREAKDSLLRPGTGLG